VGVGVGKRHYRRNRIEKGGGELQGSKYGTVRGTDHVLRFLIADSRQHTQSLYLLSGSEGQSDK
jgi:hypothetical protein